MRKQTVYCDKCGKELVDFDSTRDTILFGLTSRDLCPDCMAAALEAFDAWVAKKEPAPEPVKEKRKNSGWKKLNLDMGKIGALYTAGWNVKQIADEFGCHPHTITARLDEALKVYEDGQKQLVTKEDYE